MSIDHINCSESHTRIQRFRPLPCDDCHDHNILTCIHSNVYVVWWWPPPHGRGVKDWVWIWGSEKLLNRHQTILGVYVNKLGRNSVTWRHTLHRKKWYCPKSCIKLVITMKSIFTFVMLLKWVSSVLIRIASSSIANIYVLYLIECRCNSLCFVLHRGRFTWIAKSYLLIFAIRRSSFLADPKYIFRPHSWTNSLWQDRGNSLQFAHKIVTEWPRL